MAIETIYQKIVEILLHRLSPEKIVLIGSRARGKPSPGSDIDIAVFRGAKLSHREERKLREEIDEAVGLYSVDLAFVEQVNKGFKEIIEETGVVLYEKSRNCPGNPKS